MLNESNTIPFLKWAGGKRWLVSSYSHVFPKCFNNYYEPFLGSGSVFFKLKPKVAVLSDTNAELIDTYYAIKHDWQKVVSLLKRHHNKHCRDYYYLMRSIKPRNMYSKAARLIYLNRTCWNGLYRVNLDGIFNVPIGTKSNVIYDSDDFESISSLLQNVVLRNQDFEKVIDQSVKGDLVFVDPPYTVKHKNNGFLKYNEKLFSWDDQIRLRDCLLRAIKRGVIIISTNAAHESILSLYQGDFSISYLSRKSLISSDSTKRTTCYELLITS
jgi:DNA adenine methylase